MNTYLPTRSAKFREFCNSAGFFCAISFMVFIPSSTALMNLFIFLTLVFSLLEGEIKKKCLLVWKNPVSKISLILFFLLIWSLNWTIDSSEAVDVLKKYNELWYIALLLPLFDTNRRRNIGVKAFLISMGLILFGVYLMYFEIILPIEYTLKGRNHHFNVDGGFASHILTNILMAFAMFISGHKLVFAKHFFKLPYIVFFIFSANYVLFISNGTSGQILGISLLILLLIQHTGIRATLLIPGTLLLIAFLTISSENNGLRFAIDKMNVRWHHLVSTDTAGNNTRPRIYIHALKLIADEPWIGTGVGSFEEALRSKQSKFYEATTVAKKNPHNEYLMISVQLGAIGLLLLLYLFYIQASNSEKIRENEYRYIAQGLVVLIIVGCMGNSMILDSREGHFWAFFSALLFSCVNTESLQVKD
jgi:O-antigen ligase